MPGADATQRDVALYITNLYEAGDDCRGNLTSVRNLLNQQALEIGKQ